VKAFVDSRETGRVLEVMLSATARRARGEEWPQRRLQPLPPRLFKVEAGP